MSRFARAVLVAAVLVALVAVGASAGSDKKGKKAADPLQPVGTADECNMVIHLVLDGSGSMQPRSRELEAKAVVDTFAALQKSRPNSKLEYVTYTFGDRASFSVDRQPAHKQFTGDAAKALADPKAAPPHDAQMDPLDASANSAQMARIVKIASEDRRFVAATCHACALELVLKNLQRLTATGSQWADSQHVVLMVTDGQTNRNTATPMGTTAAAIRAIAPLGVVGVGQGIRFDTLEPVVSVDGDKKKLLYTAANFDKLAEQLTQMITAICDNPPVWIPPKKEVCDPLYVAVVLDVSKSVVDSYGRDAARYFREYVAKVCSRLDPEHSRVGVFAFAEEVFAVTPLGFMKPAEASLAAEDFDIFLTHRPAAEPAAFAATDRDAIVRAHQLKLKVPFVAAAKTEVAFATGLGAALSGGDGLPAPSPIAKVGAYQPLLSKTYHARAVRRVAAELKAAIAKDTSGKAASGFVMLVTDGGAFSLSKTCNDAYTKYDKAFNAKLGPSVDPKAASPAQKLEAQAALLCYDKPEVPEPRAYTAEWVGQYSGVCPGLDAEYKAATCCNADEPLNCDLGKALEAAKLPAVTTFLGDKWFSPTTTAAVAAANLKNEFGDGRTEFRANTIADVPNTAVEALGQGPLIKKCRMVDVEDAAPASGAAPKGNTPKKFFLF